MLVTLSTIRQLPQALALGTSFATYAPGKPVVIGLADHPASLPAGFQSPFPILPVSDLLTPDQLARLSAQYTPTEFAAACKPALIREVFQRFPTASEVLYADPNIQFFSSLTPVWEQLRSASILLTPHITQAPGNDSAAGGWPDEKHFQNVGLYSADFLAFRRSAETDRMLAWWQDRVESRAFVDFCEGLCTDQLWLMHVPVFFKNTLIIKDVSWHVALWNLPQRILRQEATRWLVNDNKPLVFANAKGLYNPDEGFFAHQNQITPDKRSDVAAFIEAYREAVSPFANVALANTQPAYGQQPEPVIVRGWRRATAKTMRSVIRWIDRVPLPVFN